MKQKMDSHPKSGYAPTCKGNRFYKTVKMGGFAGVKKKRAVDYLFDRK
jgi:hypothetical protein